jgi:hypothetical protein
MLMRLTPMVVLVALVPIGLARADWLEDAWNSKSTALHGNPAITLHSDHVSVVLPAAALDEALSQAGMTRRDALRAFLGRYGPQCSSVLDLNTAQPNLAVELQIQEATSLDDLPAESVDGMFAAMETIDIPKDERARVPHIDHVFTTLPERFDFSIDYAPEKVAHCVAPQDPIS